MQKKTAQSEGQAVQLGFYFDQTRCTGCYACVIACRDWHDIQDTAVQWRRVICHEQGVYPEVEVAYLSLSCVHCADPPCVTACPVSAITKRKQDGIVLVNREQCLGGTACGRCREACPYGSPQFGSGEDDRMQMCTLCLDRIGRGEHPVCVTACPMRALDWGPLEELQRRYGILQQARGFTPADGTGPSIVFKAQR